MFEQFIKNDIRIIEIDDEIYLLKNRLKTLEKDKKNLQPHHVCALNGFIESGDKCDACEYWNHKQNLKILEQ